MPPSLVMEQRGERLVALPPYPEEIAWSGPVLARMFREENGLELEAPNGDPVTYVVVSYDPLTEVGVARRRTA